MRHYYRVFLAGATLSVPLATATGWRKDAAKRLEDTDIGVLDPMRLWSQVVPEKTAGALALDAHIVLARELRMLAKADAVLVNMLPEHCRLIPPIEVALALGCARYLDIPVVALTHLAQGVQAVGDAVFTAAVGPYEVESMDDAVALLAETLVD